VQIVFVVQIGFFNSDPRWKLSHRYKYL